MKKKQKINKAVNKGEQILLILTALFLCVLFILRGRPVPEAGLSVRTSGGAVASSAPEVTPAAAETDVSSETNADADAAVSGPESVSDADTDGLIDLNSADIQTLCTLPGIGQVLAGRIIAYREEHGPFNRPEEVMNVSGIGEGRFSSIRDLITVQAGE